MQDETIVSKTVYHVFTNHMDEYFESIEEARDLFEHWSKEFGTARLYRQDLDQDDDLISEGCLLSHGYFPY